MPGDGHPSRRALLSAGLVGLTLKAERRIEGGFVFDSQVEGHRLRDRVRLREPKMVCRVPVVIVGSGIAGLSAAWWLDKHGLRDYLMLELEGVGGGNARWGENEVSAHPWAAHYLPVPGPDATLVRDLCQELGLLKDGVWEERYLCHSPQERLFLHGRWQDGLEPEVGATARDRAEMAQFSRRVKEFQATGEFTIPMARGAKASALDEMTFAAWLRKQGFESPYLHWYADYACRDDYGASAAATSAWAGIHYFASRAKEPDKGPLTWPEGNGWIAKRLLQRVGDRLRTRAAAHTIVREGQKWRVVTEDAEYLADAVIWAGPLFVAGKVIAGARVPKVAYSPWITANLTLDGWPEESGGGEPAWDNVIYGSKSLGYVVATHQKMTSRRPDRTVWTFYHALGEGDPASNRRMLLDRTWKEWVDWIVADLERVHRDIRSRIKRVDIFRMGHAMARPEPGFLKRVLGERPEAGERLYFAHADLSGISLFEEAQYRGVKAAGRVLEVVGGRRGAHLPR